MLGYTCKVSSIKNGESRVFYESDKHREERGRNEMPIFLQVKAYLPKSIIVKCVI